MEQFKNLGVSTVPEAAVRTAWELPWQTLPALFLPQAPHSMMMVTCTPTSTCSGDGVCFSASSPQ